MAETKSETLVKMLMHPGEYTEAVCALTACIRYYNMSENLTVFECKRLIDMSEQMRQLLTYGDTGKYSLYDFIDAVLNGDDLDWHAIADEINDVMSGQSEYAKKRMYDKLATLAARNREIYAKSNKNQTATAKKRINAVAAHESD